jgi:hypothetical protein
MVRYFCDKCKKDTKGNRLLTIPIYRHIKDDNPLDGYSVINDDGNLEQISGVSDDIDLCITCYNVVMKPMWNSIKNEING